MPQLIADLDEALAERSKLDALRIAAKVQEQRIASRLAAFMDFVVLVRIHVRNLHRKPRRKLTAAERILATSKLRETRRLRHTMGKRQKKLLKG